MSIQCEESAVEDVREFYEERAAIIEFDGGKPRWVAEALAKQDTAAYCHARGVPVCRTVAQAKAQVS